ncbi:heme exporter protein CcmD [Gilvimarinus polysaccharolyticus]|uniref:heme exporter protein CcmD n=1 Tax=Gilvimarinus polysaccharolyticus TaxID=863921 RepID=UPI0006737877|nr:heme exporter protein CcmD [Gilvimarinus polysaccharolyticus]
MIEFRFSSLADFMYMGGHGVYVWSCAAIALLILALLLVYPIVTAKAQLSRIKHQQAMQKMQQQRHQQARASSH